jgi:hypothetical protein
LTDKVLKERAQFRPWLHRHGRFDCDRDHVKVFAGEPVPFFRRRRLPGERNVREEVAVPLASVTGWRLGQPPA